MAEYRAYLEQYPNGSFAPLAQARMTATTAVEVQDHSVELAFWDSVKDSNDPAMFLAYINKYPNGDFRTLAEIRSQSAGNATALASLTGLLKSAFSNDA